jgi:hypothetical protein
MKRFLIALALVSVAASQNPVSGHGQSLEDLNIQIHGYATQGFLYTTQNNILTTSSSDGSPAWSEAVLNITSQPIPKLRVGVQGRYFLLGNFGNSVTLDWAAADYKANEKFGVRFGKVKTPSGLFNEIQDIDPSYQWSLLPQGVYPISSRNSILAHYGGVVYGTLKLGAAGGKLEYRGWGGERVIGSSDGYWVSFVEEGIVFPNGISGATWGGALHWKTPLKGLMLGASDTKDPNWSGALVDTYVVPAGPSAGVTITTKGTLVIPGLNEPSYFGQFEKGRFTFSSEYNRLGGKLDLTGISPVPDRFDIRSWYGMGSYKVTEKFTGGLYVMQEIDHATPLGPARYSKDWAVSGRYDFNQYLYAKAEQHFIDGTAQGYDSALNPHGLKPDTRLTILKVGVSF